MVNKTKIIQFHQEKKVKAQLDRISKPGKNFRTISIQRWYDINGLVLYHLMCAKWKELVYKTCSLKTNTKASPYIHTRAMQAIEHNSSTKIAYNPGL